MFCYCWNSCVCSDTTIKITFLDTWGSDYSMQQPGRLRLRPWLEEQIHSGKYPGVSWLDQVHPPPPHLHLYIQIVGIAGTHRENTNTHKILWAPLKPFFLYFILQSARIFQIPWKHAARHGWSIDRDATLFRSWAMHTGRSLQLLLDIEFKMCHRRSHWIAWWSHWKLWGVFVFILWTYFLFSYSILFVS